jgi:hypothetical protein
VHLVFVSLARTSSRLASRTPHASEARPHRSVVFVRVVGRHVVNEFTVRLDCDASTAGAALAMQRRLRSPSAPSSSMAAALLFSRGGGCTAAEGPETPQPSCSLGAKAEGPLGAPSTSGVGPQRRRRFVGSGAGASPGAALVCSGSRASLPSGPAVDPEASGSPCARAASPVTGSGPFSAGAGGSAGPGASVAEGSGPAEIGGPCSRRTLACDGAPWSSTAAAPTVHVACGRHCRCSARDAGPAMRPRGSLDHALLATEGCSALM